MRGELALVYADQRMKEIGANEYTIQIRQFGIPATQSITIEGGSDLWILCDETQFTSSANGSLPASIIRVESENGVYDIRDEEVLELEHEHTGSIKVTNQSSTLLIYVMFLQATPKKSEV